MSHFSAFETCARITRVLCSSTSTMRKFHTDLVTHKVALVVFSNTFLCCLPSVKFLRDALARFYEACQTQTYNKTVSNPITC